MTVIHKIPQQPEGSSYNPEQWEAIHYQGENILVAASAGSGKTTVLIERIMNHLLSHYAQIDQLLVVTFTDSAANEMKERMEARLKTAISQTQDADLKRAYLRELNALPSAHIQTLHSFCYQLIQDFFYLQDLNPAFTLIVDPSQIQVIQQKVWEDLIDQLANPDQNEMSESLNYQAYQELLLCFSSGRNDEALQVIVLDLLEFARSNPQPLLWIEGLEDQALTFTEFWQSDLFQVSLKKQVKGRLLVAAQSYQAALSELVTCSQACHDKYQALLEREAGQVDRLIECLSQDDLAEFLATINQLSFDRWPQSRAKDLADDLETIPVMKSYRDLAKEDLQSISSFFPYSYELMDQVEQAVQPLVKKLVRLTKAFYQDFQAYKAKEGLVDYADLEHLALNLLAPYDPVTQKRQPSPAARYYQKLFKEVMVDEYQDINEIQASILSWLSHEHRSDLPGNLFMVGDVKQSIYGFRMAEPSLFLAKYKAYQNADGGHLIILDKNYRSRYEILNFTNYIFERLMDANLGEMDYGLSEALSLGNHSFSQGSSPDHYQVEFLLHDQEGGEDAEDQKEEEGSYNRSIDLQAHLIAQDIQDKLARQYTIFDKKLGHERLLSFKDIVVLSETRAAFGPLQNAFEVYQIPFDSQAVESYFQRQEIQLILALLKIIDNPLQDIPMTAILKSYFVGLTDNQLAQIRIYHPQASFVEAVYALKHDEAVQEEGLIKIQSKLRRLFQQLEKWRLYARDHTLDQLIWQIYQETAFLDFVVGLDRGLQRQANLHAFYQKAQDLSQSLMGGLANFIHYIETMIKQSRDLAEPLVLTEDQNLVRAMTIHASKGSEFPLVYLINTNKAFNKKDIQKPVIATKNHGLGLNAYDLEQMVTYSSVSKKARQILLEEGAKAEQMRVLYVALTRVEQKLVIVGTIKSQDKWQDMMDKAQQLTAQGQNKLALSLRSAANDYLTWLGQCLALAERQAGRLANLNANDFQVTMRSGHEIRRGIPQQEVHSARKNLPDWLMEHIRNSDDKTELTRSKKEIHHLLSGEYPYRLASQTSAYQSVSELKRLNEEPPHQALSYYQDRRMQKGNSPEELSIAKNNDQGIQSIRYTQDSFVEPSFIRKDQMDPARIGTLNHYLMEELNYQSFVGLAINQYQACLDQQVASLIERKQIQATNVNYLYKKQILNFLKGSLGQELIKGHAGLQKERAFSYLVPADHLFESLADRVDLEAFGQDSILVHGVIDLYYVIPNEGFVLVDFKTDRYRPYANQSKTQQLAGLKEKYRYQMTLYQKALKRNLKLPCIAAYLVALDFEEVLEM